MSEETKLVRQSAIRVFAGAVAHGAAAMAMVAFGTAMAIGTGAAVVAAIVIVWRLGLYLAGLVIS